MESMVKMISTFVKQFSDSIQKLTLVSHVELTNTDIYQKLSSPLQGIFIKTAVYYHLSVLALFHLNQLFFNFLFIMIKPSDGSLIILKCEDKVLWISNEETPIITIYGFSFIVYNSLHIIRVFFITYCKKPLMVALWARMRYCHTRQAWHAGWRGFCSSLCYSTPELTVYLLVPKPRNQTHNLLLGSRVA